MRVLKPKLSKDAVKELRRIEPRLMKPNVVLPSPVYVFLPLNEKFVAIKPPMGFFTPQELTKMKNVKGFYFSNLVDELARFQKAGEAVKNAFGMRDKIKLKSSQGSKEISIPISSFDMEDAVLRLTAELWGPHGRIELFFLNFFASELCDPIPTEMAEKIYDEYVDRFEMAHFRSSLAVFLALHLGWCSQACLNSIRKRSFERTALGKDTKDSSPTETENLLELVEELIPDVKTKEVFVNVFENTNVRMKAMIGSRIARIRAEFMNASLPDPTVYGEKGFAQNE